MRIDRIILKSVNIKNFKVYSYSDEGETFNFGSNKAILITGANGYGKTTLVEAIEWCLTGEVGRIRNCYDKRNTTAAERARGENLSGLFKNRDCQNKPIEVAVALNINDKDIVITRKQKDEGIGKKNILDITGDIDEETKEALITLLAKETYYKYNVCDTLKSYKFLTSKRQDIYELFEDFLKERPKFSDVIERFPEIEEIIEDDSSELSQKIDTNLNVLEQKSSKLIDLKKNTNKVEYPAIKIFESEITDIMNLSIPELDLQLKILKKIATIHTQSLIKSLIDNERYSINKKELNNLLEFSINNDTLLSLVLEKGYHSLEELNKTTLEFNNLKRKKEIFRLCNTINDYKINILENQNLFNSEQMKDYKLQVESLEIKNSIIDILEEEIKTMEKGNEILSALSDIVKNKQAFLLYKQQGETKCPLCGAEEKFSNISELNQIGIEAEQYLEKASSILLEKKILLQKEKDELNNLINILKDGINNYLNEQYNIISENEAKFRKYYNDSYDFINSLSKYEIRFDLDFLESIKMKIAYMDTVISDDTSKSKTVDELRNFLIILDNIPKKDDLNFDNLNELRRLELEVKSLIDEENSYNENQHIEFNILNSKINSLNCLLMDNEIKCIEKEIELIKKQNVELMGKIGRLKNYSIKLSKVKSALISKQKKLEVLELDSVGPYIFEIYKKIIRHSNINNIKLVRDQAKEGGSVLVDESGNNILNTFSQGQLGILIIAYFFANMFRRKEDMAFKTYFMDDITNCLDDMNVYSFIDMVKHLLYSQDNVLNQFFFSTCEENIEKLFVNKMKSYNIGVTKVKFFDYGKFEITDL